MPADPIDVQANEPTEETVVRWNRYKEARRAGLLYLGVANVR